MRLLIIGIALYEAWKINRNLWLSISGPHRVETEPEPLDNCETGPPVRACG
jgi:hypothetical protein